METLNWAHLADVVKPQSGKILYESNKHLFTKMAFDVFQLNTSSVDSLWVLENGEDGKQYLVARYEDTTETPLEAKSCWAAFSDKEHKNVTLLYKDTPIQRFASSEFGFDDDDIYIFQKTLIHKINSDKSF